MFSPFHSLVLLQALQWIKGESVITTFLETSTTVTKALTLPKQFTLTQQKPLAWTEDENLAFLRTRTPVSAFDRKVLQSWCRDTEQAMPSLLVRGIVYLLSCMGNELARREPSVSGEALPNRAGRLWKTQISEPLEDEQQGSVLEQCGVIPSTYGSKGSPVFHFKQLLCMLAAWLDGDSHLSSDFYA